MEMNLGKIVKMKLMLMGHTFNTLTISTYYSIQVRTKNSNGNGDWSNYITYFTADTHMMLIILL